MCSSPPGDVQTQAVILLIRVVPEGPPRACTKQNHSGLQQRFFSSALDDVTARLWVPRS